MLKKSVIALSLIGSSAFAMDQKITKENALATVATAAKLSQKKQIEKQNLEDAINELDIEKVKKFLPVVGITRGVIANYVWTQRRLNEPVDGDKMYAASYEHAVEKRQRDCSLCSGIGELLLTHVKLSGKPKNIHVNDWKHFINALDPYRSIEKALDHYGLIALDANIKSSLPQELQTPSNQKEEVNIEALREMLKANPHLIGLKKRIDEYDAAQKKRNFEPIIGNFVNRISDFEPFTE